MGPFVRRLVALTAVWLLATAALTYAAARRVATPHTSGTTSASTTTQAPQTLTVPDVRRQAYVFAEGTLSDAGFGWRVEGAVHGYAANTVASQSPAPGTRVIDTGNPTIVLRLSGSSSAGQPQDVSDLAGTALRLADLAVAPVVTPKQPVPVKKAAPAKKAAPLKKAAPAKKAPAKTPRPPAFVVPGARREPLDEMPLPDRATMLLRWIDRKPKPTDANVRYWLYQHAWIVAGARMGWWHGSAALRTLLQVDNRVWDLWGIGARSEQYARRSLAEVEARSS
ncbi:MAG TPA: PASTA domain-containing protein [Gaiellaceae bacterium]